MPFKHGIVCDPLYFSVQSCPVLPSKDGGVWYTNNTLENATANFLCGMGYRISGSCPPTTCKNGTWSNFRHCSCIKILTSPPTSTRRTTFTSIPQSRTPPSLTPAPTSQSTRFPMSIGHQMTSIATRISTLEPSSAGQTAVSSTPQSQEHQPRTPPPTSQSTRTVAYVAHQTTPVPTKDNYNFLKFISNKAHVWFINGVGVVFIIFIILIGSFVTCKIRYVWITQYTNVFCSKTLHHHLRVHSMMRVILYIQCRYICTRSGQVLRLHVNTPVFQITWEVCRKRQWKSTLLWTLFSLSEIQ